MVLDNSCFVTGVKVLVVKDSVDGAGLAIVVDWSIVFGVVGDEVTGDLVDDGMRVVGRALVGILASVEAWKEKGR